MKNHFQLNGTKGWVFLFVLTIVIQSIAIGIWAGTMSTDIKYIKADLAEVKEDVKRLYQKES